MNPVDLGRVLDSFDPPIDRENLLVGFQGGDDAAVYKVREDLAIIHTLDFFTPIVDDPYCFGQIAAANALSDVYAMGGNPLMALNIVCFPSKSLDLSILEEILKGGGDKVREAKASLAGGHTIDDDEPKYGLAVMGQVRPDRLITNSRAQVGDLLLLTKPIGGGIVTTGIKRGYVKGEILEELVLVMSTLNDVSSKGMQRHKAHACTDITGFGLLGHGYEMARASGVTLEIQKDKVPLLSGTKFLVKKGILPGGTKANLKYLEDKVIFSSNCTQEDGYLLSDAMTSGGLLISLPEDRAYQLQDELGEEKGIRPAIIGRVIESKAGSIYVC